VESNEIAVIEAGIKHYEPLQRMAYQPPDQQPANVYVLRLAKGSGRSIKYALGVIARTITSGEHDAETLPWGQLRYQHTAALRSVLQEVYGPASVNKFLVHLRGVLKEAWRLGQMDTDEYMKAVQVESIKNEKLPAGRALKSGEMRALFEACDSDDSRKGVRDVALFAVLYGSGLRRAEIVALDLADYDQEGSALVIRAGKGNKDRIVYVSDEVKDVLALWLDLRGSEPGPMFLPIRKGGGIEMRRMTEQAIFFVLNARAKQAGVQNVSPHDFRYTFISDLLDAGADISTVQKLAGHANITTTQRYDRRGEDAKRKVAQMLHVPIAARRSKAKEQIAAAL
jgi:site-specific recombinase XerD